MDDVITPKMWRNFEDIIEEGLVEIQSKEQFLLLYLAKEYELESKEFSVTRKFFKDGQNRSRIKRK